MSKHLVVCIPTGRENCHKKTAVQKDVLFHFGQNISQLYESLQSEALKHTQTTVEVVALEITRPSSSTVVVGIHSSISYYSV